MNHQVRISELQLAVLMASSFTALGLFTFPRDLIEGAGRQAYWGLLLAALISGLTVLLIVRLGLQFPGKTPVQYIRKILGGTLGTMIGIWLVLFHTALAAATLRYFGDLVNTFFLPRTPPEVIMLLMLTAVLYINWYGLESMTRFIFLVYPLTLGLVALTFAATLGRVSETVAMLPPVTFDLGDAVAGAWRIMYVFIGVESISMLLPFVRRPKRPYRYALAVVGANALALLLILVATLGIWGTEPARYLQYPGMATLRVLRLPGLLVERLGGFVATTWTLLGLCFLCVRFWTNPTATAQLFGLGPRETRYFLFPMGLMTLFLARWPFNPEELEGYVGGFIVPLGVASNLGMNLLLQVIAWARGLGQRA